MTRYTRFALALSAALLFGLARPSPLIAAGPTLKVTCGLPTSQDLVSCTLSGLGFHPREQVRITYRVTFTALPKRHGHFPEDVYHRTALTDTRGAFARPPLRFAVVRYHEAYRLTVVAAGARGDHAGTTLIAIAQ